MTPFQPTDSGWPPLMRVNPILAWDYHQLWEFVRALTLSYCSLYDKGCVRSGGAGTGWSGVRSGVWTGWYGKGTGMVSRCENPGLCEIRSGLPFHLFCEF